MNRRSASHGSRFKKIVHETVGGIRCNGGDNGNIFYGDEGTVSMGRKGWRVTFKDGSRGLGGGHDDKSHIKNFLKAVRSQDPSTLAAGVLDGHHASALCHAANIAIRVGRGLNIDAATERFVDDPEATGYLRRAYRKGFEPPAG